MNPANAKARALLGKLERLVDPANGGTPDEIVAATQKLERLRNRYDFSDLDPAEVDQMDIFAGISSKRKTRRTSHVYTFQPSDFDIANSVKWAIEHATGIPCKFRGGELLAEGPARTANQLAKVALHISECFRTLLTRFGKLHGVTTSDRRLFVRGLYDGMMDDRRGVGERLPGDAAFHGKRKKTKKRWVEHPPQLAVHPYNVAMTLGRRIRFAAPVEEIAAELDRVTQPVLGPGSSEPADG